MWPQLVAKGFPSARGRGIIKPKAVSSHGQGYTLSTGDGAKTWNLTDKAEIF